MGIISSKQLHLKPAWEYTVNGQIWRLLPSPDGYLIGEERNGTTMSVSFFCLKQRSGEINWKDFQPGEQWWVGLDTIHKNIVFLHGYASPDWPVHKKIIAIEVENGRVLWTNEDVRYLFATEEFVYAAKEVFDGMIFMKLNIADGSLIEELNRESLDAIRATVSSVDTSDIEFPISRSDAPMESGQNIHTLIRNDGGGTKIAFMECIEKNNVSVIGYYESMTTSEAIPDYRLKIAIIDMHNDRIVYQDVMNSYASVIHPETFFIMNDIVHYIKEKKSIIAIKIPIG